MINGTSGQRTILVIIAVLVALVLVRSFYDYEHSQSAANSLDSIIGVMTGIVIGAFAISPNGNK